MAAAQSKKRQNESAAKGPGKGVQPAKRAKKVTEAPRKGAAPAAPVAKKYTGPTLAEPENEAFYNQLNKKGNESAYDVVKNIMEGVLVDEPSNKPLSKVEFFADKFGCRIDINDGQERSPEANFIQGVRLRNFPDGVKREKAKALVRLFTFFHHQVPNEIMDQIVVMSAFSESYTGEAVAAIKNIPKNLLNHLFSEFFVPYVQALRRYYHDQQAEAHEKKARLLLEQQREEQARLQRAREKKQQHVALAGKAIKLELEQVIDDDNSSNSGIGIKAEPVVAKKEEVKVASPSSSSSSSRAAVDDDSDGYGNNNNNDSDTEAEAGASDSEEEDGEDGEREDEEEDVGPRSRPIAMPASNSGGSSAQHSPIIELCQLDDDAQYAYIADFIRRAPAKLHRHAWRRVDHGGALGTISPGNEYEIDFESIFCHPPAKMPPTSKTGNNVVDDGDDDDDDDDDDNGGKGSKTAAAKPPTEKEIADELDDWRRFLQQKLFLGFQYTLRSLAKLEMPCRSGGGGAGRQSGKATTTTTTSSSAASSSSSTGGASSSSSSSSSTTAAAAAAAAGNAVGGAARKMYISQFRNCYEEPLISRWRPDFGRMPIRDRKPLRKIGKSDKKGAQAAAIADRSMGKWMEDHKNWF